MKALSALLLGVLLTANAHAEPTWVGGGVAVQAVGRDAMVGDAAEILSGLGVPADESDLRFVPRAHVAFDLYDAPRLATGLGIDLEASWFARSVEGKNALLSYRVRRDLVPLAAMFRIGVGRKERGRFQFGVGPVLAWSRFSESGWLGDGTRNQLGYGFGVSLGGRFPLGEAVRALLGFGAQLIKVPHAGTLVADGGTAWTAGAFVGLEFGL